MQAVRDLRELLKGGFEVVGDPQEQQACDLVAVAQTEEPVVPQSVEKVPGVVGDLLGVVTQHVSST